MTVTPTPNRSISHMPRYFHLTLSCMATLLLAGLAWAGPQVPQTQPATTDNAPPEKTVIIDRYLVPSWPEEQAYREGLRNWRAKEELDAAYKARNENLLRTRDDALKAGLDAFAQGQYDQAADYFQLGAELDHGDAASRIHAAQALFALEQYDQAVPLLRRALELQPSLIRLKFDLKRDYGQLRDFEEQIEALRRFVAANPSWQDGCLLLGYELLYSGQRTEAHNVLTRAVALNPTDKLAVNLHKASVPLPQPRVPKMRPTVQPTVSRATRA